MIFSMTQRAYETPSMCQKDVIYLLTIISKFSGGEVGDHLGVHLAFFWATNRGDQYLASIQGEWM